MFSSPQYPNSILSLNANGWIDQSTLAGGVRIPSGMVVHNTYIVNRGTADIWASYDQVNEIVIAAGGSDAIEEAFVTGANTALYLRNDVNGSNGTRISIVLT